MSIFRRHRHTIYIVGGLLAGILVVLLGYSTYVYLQSDIEEHGVVLEEVPGFRAVHWHARLDMYACGAELRLPLNRGTPLLHTHKDPHKIHIEGLVPEGKSVTLGEFMDAVEVPFSSTQLLEYQNDNSCPDEEPDTLYMTVNGQENAAFRDYEIRDGDVIILIYD